MNETRIDKIDYVVVSLYLLFGAFIGVSYKFSILRQENINMILLALTFGGPFSLFLMYYKRLRIPTVSLIWFVIGISQWYLVDLLKSNPDFDSAIGTFADYDLNLLAMIIIFTVFRFLSLLTTKQEFMMAAWFSPKDNRNLNPLDYILTFTGLIILIIIIKEV
ncbi:hypothetical protein FVB9288_02386 [Flavobacterium sp. CECT 9288]|uniref:hypothetical protein n=1 Tax=Flavobacterium sp. CECT 9288 TaxID=2845819 RepID=UPI001E60E438|nr:hypothetical protein [Flavobacterium sp. CECT 9288]CAH0336675.1 hypothetical protein FVB9288_02386 [Flavobacterium sp. CECT 9288]